MGRARITDILKSGKILISDGAWGTFLQKKGLKPGECPELWCVTRRRDVLDIAKSYIDAGADMIETNSFGANSFKLEHYGLADRSAELNEAAARISREAAGDDRFVIGSVGPTGKILMMGDIEEDALYNSFKVQVSALEKGGADACCIETMSALDEALLAVRAAKENTKMEVICTFTFEKTLRGDYRTMMGLGPYEMAEKMTEAGADIIGTNCGNGIRNMIDIVAEIRKASPNIPILVHANAGLPVNRDGVDFFPDSPRDMAASMEAIIVAGANIIGGCCGTAPEHISAMKAAVNKSSSANVKFIS